MHSHIFACLFVENLVQVAAGLFFAWMFIDASQPLMERYLGIPQMDYKAFDWQASLALLVGLPFVTTLYPFWKHVHKAPITSMQSVGAMSRPGVSRDVFLFLQYVITSTLAVFAIYFISHLNYILHTDMGYNTRNIVTATLSSEEGTYNIRNEEEWEKMQEEMHHKARLLLAGFPEEKILCVMDEMEAMDHVLLQGVEKIYRRLQDAGLTRVSLSLYPEMRHEILNELSCQTVWSDLLTWIQESIKSQS